MFRCNVSWKPSVLVPNSYLRGEMAWACHLSLQDCHLAGHLSVWECHLAGHLSVGECHLALGGGNSLCLIACRRARARIRDRRCRNRIGRRGGRGELALVIRWGVMNSDILNHDVKNKALC